MKNTILGYVGSNQITMNDGELIVGLHHTGVVFSWTVNGYKVTKQYADNPMAQDIAMSGGNFAIEYGLLVRNAKTQRECELACGQLQDAVKSFQTRLVKAGEPETFSGTPTELGAVANSRDILMSLRAKGFPAAKFLDDMAMDVLQNGKL